MKFGLKSSHSELLLTSLQKQRPESFIHLDCKHVTKTMEDSSGFKIMHLGYEIPRPACREERKLS